MTDEEWRKKLNGYFIAFTRKTFRWSPAYREVVSRAEVKDGTVRRYRCADCQSLVERSEKQVDHIEPVVAVTTRWNGDWNLYRDRVFVSSEKLRVLCRKCHREKTNKENAQRKRGKAKVRAVRRKDETGN